MAKGRIWGNFGWYPGSEFKFLSFTVFENTGGAKGDWCYFHFQIAKFVIAFGRWRR